VTKKQFVEDILEREGKGRRVWREGPIPALLYSIPGPKINY